MERDRDINHLHPMLVPLAQEFIVKCHMEGINVFITETYRSPEQQRKDYDQGRTCAGPIITNAKPGESPHNWLNKDGNPSAKAFDFAIMGDDKKLDWNPSHPSWRRAIEIGRALGMVSGALFKYPDKPHMELPNWKTLTN